MCCTGKVSNIDQWWWSSLSVCSLCRWPAFKRSNKCENGHKPQCYQSEPRWSGRTAAHSRTTTAHSRTTTAHGRTATAHGQFGLLWMSQTFSMLEENFSTFTKYFCKTHWGEKLNVLYYWTMISSSCMKLNECCLSTSSLNTRHLSNLKIMTHN